MLINEKQKSVPKENFRWKGWGMYQRINESHSSSCLWGSKGFQSFGFVAKAKLVVKRLKILPKKQKNYLLNDAIKSFYIKIPPMCNRVAFYIYQNILFVISWSSYVFSFHQWGNQYSFSLVGVCWKSLEKHNSLPHFLSYSVSAQGLG